MSGDTVTVTLRLDSIRALPDGAAFVAQDRRAHVMVRRGKTPETVEITAVADSVGRVVRSVESVRRERASERVETQTATARKTCERHTNGIIAAGALAVAVFVGTILTTLKKRRE